MKRILSIVAFISLALSALVAQVTPANAAGEANDASLASFSVSGWSALNGGFTSERTNYEIASKESDFDWNFATANPNASMVLTEANGTQHNFGSSALIHLNFQAYTDQLTTIKVTSADASTTKTYSFNVSSKAIVSPELISLSQTVVPNSGGIYVTAKVNHSIVGGYSCNTGMIFTYPGPNGEKETSNSGYEDYSYLNDGTALVTFWVPATYENFRYVGKADLTLKNSCYGVESYTGWWTTHSSETKYKDYVTYANPKLDSVSIPEKVSFGTTFDVRGFGLSAWADLNVYMQDPETEQKIWRWDSWMMNDQWARYRIGGTWDESKWGKSKPVDIVVAQYDESENNEDFIIVKKRVTFEPFLPKNVVLSPAKGPIAGNNVVKIQGFALCNYFQEREASVRIGGIEAYTFDWSCNYENASDGYTWDGIDRAKVTIPAGTKAGQVDIEVNNGFGWVTLPYKYTYGGTPTLSAVSPSTVANTGSSVITITGTNFGISGTPTVTVDGIKAPWVQRVSATKLLAMVPEVSGKTGPVDLNVISSSGGGALDSPGSITLTAASANPTISSVTPNKAGLSGGDTITIKGSGFVAGATGVFIGDYPAPVISSSATSLEVELPSGDLAGAVSVLVGTPTGIATKANAFTYSATPGVTSISPASIAATSASNKVTITGVGFGTKGTIKVGSGAAVAYTSSANGTTISNIAIPTTKTGSVAIVITPTGAKTPFTASVSVTGPKITYFGTNPKINFLGASEYGSGYAKPTASTAGGESFLIEGTGFGSAGKVKIGETLVTPTSYTDTAILFKMPAKSAAVYDVTVVPTVGSLTGILKAGVGYYTAVKQATITGVQSSEANTRNEPNFTFNAADDSSDLFTIFGSLLAGTDASKTKVYLNNEDTPITPVSVNNDQITFHAPRSYSPVQWISVKVVTNLTEVSQRLGILYVGNVPPPTTMTPGRGLCLKDSFAGRNPAQLTATSDSRFGDSGTVSIDGSVLPAAAVTWSTAQVNVNLDNMTTDLVNPWGGKTVTFTPDDSTKVPQSFGFTCGVDANVETKINGNNSSVTINAGTTYTTAAAFTDALPAAPFTPVAGGYSYQTAEDHGIQAWARNVKSGLPVAAGDYYVRVNVGSGTYDRDKYAVVSNSNEVHLVIEGTPISFTPKLGSGTGNSITYKGQLGDGSSQSTKDITYTSTNVPDDVTSVTWQYRNKTCAQNDPNWGWSSGLPRDVAIAPAGCGGDGTSISSWEIRVASFEMLSGGVDKSIYYLPTYNTFNLTINKKSVTATSVKAEKVYDGTTSVVLGEITLTGSVAGDEVTLDPTVAQGATYVDATAGNSKAITLSGPLALSGYWSTNYTLTNPNLAITGKILKATARVKLTPSVSSVIMTSAQNFSVSVGTVDVATNLEPDPAAGISPVVVSSKTPTVCSYNAGTVTPIKAGDCIIEARQAASTNYNASVSYRDPDVTVESVTIKIYPAPKTLSVVADDVTVAVGESVGASAVVTGLLEGDGLDGFSFDFYQGATLLNAAPTAVGTYKIVPKGGSLSALDIAAYTNTVKYVAGKLVITPAPPVLTSISPAHGPEAGGNKVVIKGTGLSAVTSVSIGEITLRKPKFTVNGDGTELSFIAPKGVGVVDVVLKAGSAQVSGQYLYDPPPPITAPLNIKLKLNLEVGVKFSGQKVTISGGGLKANSEYTLYLHSKEVLIYKANTDAQGNFLQTVTMPGKACVESGKHDLTLTGTAPDGSAAKDSASFVLDEKCNVAATAVKTDTKEWTLSGFLFDYNDYSLTSGGASSLSKLVPLIKGAKTVTIYGYTETDTKSEAVKKANLILAANRCETVMKFLKAKGIKAVYKTLGKGGVNPVSLTDQSKNRRVVIEANF